jgi:hypothetical protein
VVAAVVDEAGNPGSATQSLTVDTVPPVVSIVGGSTRSQMIRLPRSVARRPTPAQPLR